MGSFSVTGRLAFYFIMGSVGPFPGTGRQMRPVTDTIHTELFEFTARRDSGFNVLDDIALDLTYVLLVVSQSRHEVLESPCEVS